MTYDPDAADLASLRQLIADLTYKLGWRFMLSDPDFRSFDMATLLIRYNAPDAYQPERTIPITARFPVPYLPGLSCDEWMRWLHSLIMQVEMHEVGEFFVVAGERPFDPHARRTSFPV